MVNLITALLQVNSYSVEEKKDNISPIPPLSSVDSEKFYQDKYAKYKIETMSFEKVLEMPQQVRLLDAEIYANKIFPSEASKSHELASLMSQDPKLHWYLRQNSFHSQYNKFPIPPFSLDEGKLIFNFNGEKIPWEIFKEKLGKEITLWKVGQMKNAWVGFDGIKSAPTNEEIKELKAQAEALTKLKGPDVNKKFLELMEKGFVKADIIPNKDGITSLFMSAHVDTPVDQPSQTHVHGYFAINVPSEDGRSIHRFVMGKERLEYNWGLQPGRLSLLDVRHHRHFSKNKQPIGVDFAIPEEKAKGFYIELLDAIEESEIYGQHRFNCCSLQSKLLNLIGIKWDTEMHPMAYFFKELVPEKGSTIELVVNTLFNTYFFLKGAGNVSDEAKDVLTKREVKQIENVMGVPSLLDLINPELTYIDSPYQSGQRCLEVMKYRHSFIALFEQAAYEMGMVSHEAIAEAKREIEKSVNFLIPSSMLLFDDGREEKVLSLIEDKIRGLTKQPT